ncbi:N amino acid transport system protein like [Verticillium longisporum]|nr:N amino acid transport system protein like [Verticillium longisporum]
MDHDEIVQSRYADANSDKKAQDVKQAEDSEKMAQEEAIAPQFSRGAPFGEVVGEVTDLNRADLEKQKAAEGSAHFHRLGWKRLTIVLIVEAIALGSLSIPSAFATLGMVAGVILCQAQVPSRLTLC